MEGPTIATSLLILHNISATSTNQSLDNDNANDNDYAYDNDSDHRTMTVLTYIFYCGYRSRLDGPFCTLS